MKRIVKSKSLVKIKRKKVKHTCYFCGTDKGITRHHIVFRIFLNGQTLENNIEYLCKKCHKKFHILVQPVINVLVKTMTGFQPHEISPIGFIRTNGKKKAKKKRGEII